MKKIFFAVFLFVFFSKPSFVFAEVIHSFDVNITAKENGQMDVIETIDYDFENLNRHGIYRSIPLYTKVGDLYRIIKIGNVIIERDGSPEKFSKIENKNQIEFKIGNANKTITGEHVYKIYYTVSNGIGSNFPDHDEIYWNATGNNWEIVIEKAAIVIDTDFKAKPQGVICFTGGYFSKEKNCKTEENRTFSLNSLNPKEGLSIVSIFPVNTFPKSILSKNPQIGRAHV